MKVDYIIVGQGFAGSFFACELLLHNKSFIIIDADKNKASSIAAGIFNPIVLKRFTPIWEADLQIDFFIKKIKKLEQFFETQFLVEESIVRIIDNIQEKKIWHRKARNKLKKFLNPEIIDLHNNISANFGLGQVHKSGRIEVSHFLTQIKEYCKEKYFNEEFTYNKLIFKENKIQYNNFTAINIVFCEGMGMLQNPFFNTIPLKTNKGECLLAELSKPLDSFIYKKKHFLFKENKTQYYIGATNNSEDKTQNCTESAKSELLLGVNEIYKYKIKTTIQKAALRPTSIDRRPIVGRHNNYKNIYLINGLGTRGTLLGVKSAHDLFQFIENKIPIPEEIDVKRFY